MMWLIFLLLFCAEAFAAQTFTIPLGTTTWGPWSTTVANHYSDFNFSRSLWTDPNSHLTATIEYSADKGKTWVFLCRIQSQGGPGGGTTGFTCPLPVGTTTNIRAITVVTGSAITIPNLPNGGAK